MKADRARKIAKNNSLLHRIFRIIEGQAYCGRFVADVGEMGKHFKFEPDEKSWQPTKAELIKNGYSVTNRTNLRGDVLAYVISWD